MLAQFGLAQLARDAGQGPQMFTIGARRGEQGEDEIDGLAVNGIEIDRLIQTHKHGAHPVQTFEPGMGDRDAVTNPGGALGLAIAQGVEHQGGVETESTGGELGGQGQNMPFSIGMGLLNYGALIEPGAHIHCSLLKLKAAGSGDHHLAEPSGFRKVALHLA